MIVRNRIRCISCDDVIESVTVHDFNWCSCGKVAVDGGRDYLRRVGARYQYMEMSEVKKDPPPPKVSDTRKDRTFKPSRPETADTALLRVLEALKERPHNSVELSQPEIGGLRFGARIKELKDDGWDIVTKHIEGKSYCLYTLRGRKSEDKRQISLF